MEDVNKDGGYDGWGYVMQDRRNHFRMEVKKMELKGGKIVGADGTNKVGVPDMRAGACKKARLEARVPDVGAGLKARPKAAAGEEGTRKQPVVVS